ncbi:hypothetical protein B0H13DRAFT_2358161 [Mycena leptocephala]|nr:hypothetical protein B0H13DRAFT_2358161 [Mycena leptocephala]
MGLVSGCVSIYGTPPFDCEVYTHPSSQTTPLRDAFLHASPILASTPWRRCPLLVSATPFLVLARLGLGRSPYVLDGSAITNHPSLLPSSSPVNARSCRRQKPDTAACQWLFPPPTEVTGILNRIRLAPCTYASAPDLSCASSLLDRHTHPRSSPRPSFSCTSASLVALHQGRSNVTATQRFLLPGPATPPAGPLPELLRSAPFLSSRIAGIPSRMYPISRAICPISKARSIHSWPQFSAVWNWSPLLT